MEYTEIDLEIEDIMWFAIDKNGVIFEATSGGCANVPAFVIKSKEENEQLNGYFLGLSEGNANSVFLEELNPSYQSYKDCLTLTKNGITCFDIDDNNSNIYKKIAETSSPKKIESLPENIRYLLAKRLVDTDVIKSSELSVAKLLKD